MKKIVAKWKQGARVNVDPEVAQAELDKIAAAHDGAIKPEHVVKAAKRKQSPLHSHFEWDETKAAAAYRLEQARYMIRSLEIVVSESTSEAETRSYTVKRFQSLGTGIEDGKDSKYHPTERVMSDSELRSRVLHKIWNQLQALRRQYADLTEFARVWEAVDEAAKQMVG